MDSVWLFTNTQSSQIRVVGIYYQTKLNFLEISNQKKKCFLKSMFKTIQMFSDQKTGIHFFKN